MFSLLHFLAARQSSQKLFAIEYHNRIAGVNRPLPHYIGSLISPILSLPKNT